MTPAARADLHYASPMLSWIRRWPRHALIVFAVALALFAFGYWRTWALVNAKPHPTVDYLAQLNELVASDQPDGENAWPLYRQLLIEDFEIVGAPGERSETYRALSDLRTHSNLLIGQWNAMDRTAELARLESLDPLLRALNKLAEHRVYARPYNEGDELRDETVPYSFAGPALLFATVPELASFHLLSNLNTSAIRAAAERGDWEAAATRFHVGLRMGEQLARQATSIEHMIAVASASSALQEAAQLLQEHDVPESAARAMLSSIAGFDWDSRSMIRRAIRQDDLIRRDMIQWSHTKSGMLLISKLQEWDGIGFDYGMDFLMTPVASPWAPNRRVAESQSDQWLAYAFQSLEAGPPALRRPGVLQLQMEDQLHPIVDMLIWGIERAMDAVFRLESQVHGVRLMLLELRHAEGVVWPESLEAAIGDDEAIDPASGRPFSYQRTPDDKHGRPFVLRIPWMESEDPNAVINPPREPLPISPGEVVDEHE